MRLGLCVVKLRLWRVGLINVKRRSSSRSCSYPELCIRTSSVDTLVVTFCLFLLELYKSNFPSVRNGCPAQWLWAVYGVRASGFQQHLHFLCDMFSVCPLFSLSFLFTDICSVTGTGIYCYLLKSGHLLPGCCCTTLGHFCPLPWRIIAISTDSTAAYTLPFPIFWINVCKNCVYWS